MAFTEHSKGRETRSVLQTRVGRHQTDEDFFNKLNTGNKLLDPLLSDPLNLTQPNFAPKAGSPILSGAFEVSDSFFAKAPHIGAIGNDDWTKGWTTFVKN